MGTGISGAHFVWAFSLMFLFSGRGYWQELIESIIWAHNKLKVSPATQPKALSIVQGSVVRVTHYLLGGIVTTWAFFLARIITPRLSSGTTTRRIWFGIATAHDFESHDDITEERLYQNIFASHLGQSAIIFLWSFGNLYHVAWLLSHGCMPLHIWYTIRLRTHEDPYTGALFLLCLSAISLRAGSLHLYPKWKPSLLWFKIAESRFNQHLSGLSE
ncbi:putative photosystem I [Dioscorea sansibarensis]